MRDDACLASNSDEDYRKMTSEAAMYRAIVRGDSEAVKELLGSDPSILRVSKVGKSWLHWAVQRGYTDIAKLLVEAGLDVDGLTDDGTSTALDIAAGLGRIDACMWLIEQNADLNRGFGQSATPIFSAIYGKSLEVVKLFVAKGARLDAVFGAPVIGVISYANQYGTPEILEFLQNEMP